jgi:hypothetical protein
MRASLGGRILCDTGPNMGLYRYDGSLYLTPREDEQLTGELASPAGLPAVGAGRFELRRSDDIVKLDLELTCTRCELVLCDAEADDDLTTLVEAAAGHECDPAAVAEVRRKADDEELSRRNWVSDQQDQIPVPDE